MLKKNYSGKEIIHAGERLVDPELISNKDEFEKVLDILSFWRFSHEEPLDEALKILETLSMRVDKSAIFAKRLKRFISIRNKLLRFDKMKLKNMQDIGGCRAIVSNKKKLMQIARALKDRQEFKVTDGKFRYKDYVLTPKDDGYRSYHLIGQFKDASGDTKNIEVQVRTRLQHDWATAVEIVDLFTKQSLKSNQGKEKWQLFFKEVSLQFAIMEDIHLFSIKDSLKISEYVNVVNKNQLARDSCLKVQSLIYELAVIDKFEGFANTLKIVENRLEKNEGYVLIEINLSKSVVTTTIFSDDENQEAENKYVEAEKQSVGKDMVIALVYASTVGEIKEAYPNYFADSTDFLEHLLLVKNVQVHWTKQ